MTFDIFLVGPCVFKVTEALKKVIMKSNPHTLGSLRRLSGKQLTELHDLGQCPDLSLLQGRLDGAVLANSLLAKLGVWRGKIFLPSDSLDKVRGFNRLGLACVEIHRFGFTGVIKDSVFSPRKILFLDHAHSGNPIWVRNYHDEVVAISDGLYVGKSHRWVEDRLVFSGYFGLQLKSIDGGNMESKDCNAENLQCKF